LRLRQVDGKDFSSQTVMQNLKVLAIDQSTEAGKDAKSLIGAVATLQVPAGDAEVLARAQAQAKFNGVLSLVLRSYADMAGPSGAVTRGPTGAAASIAVFRGASASEVTVTR
jgi:pilus assembly protein CpaB